MNFIHIDIVVAAAVVLEMAPDIVGVADSIAEVVAVVVVVELELIDDDYVIVVGLVLVLELLQQYRWVPEQLQL